LDNFPSNYDEIPPEANESTTSDYWTMYNSEKSGNSPVFINLASFRSGGDDKKSKESYESGNVWYKGTPISKDQPVSYDPFERQNRLRSFPPKSDDVAGKEEDDSRNKFYFPNY
jgi:hypothetical protein